MFPRDPDGAGPADSPIADAIETALSEISISGAVGDALSAHLTAPFTAINESSAGLDFRSNADFYTTPGASPQDCAAVPGAPRLPNTYDLPAPYTTPAGTTPSGQTYGLGLVISSSAFNQLLGAMTECGLLNQDMTTINLGGSDLPVTSTLLSVLVPQFATALPANTPMIIRLDPTFGPFLIQQGLLMRTPRGRVATPAAWSHLGLTPPEGTPGPTSLFDQRDSIGHGDGRGDLP